MKVASTGFLKGIGVAVLLFCVWLAFRPSRAIVNAPHLQTDRPIPNQVEKNKAPSVMPTQSPIQQSAANPKLESPFAVNTKALEKAKSIAYQTELELVVADSTGIHLSDAACALLGLTASQAGEFTAAITRFLDRLYAQEIAHAYVAVSANGHEEIVVPPFDRAKMIDSLRADLTAKLGPEVAELAIGRLPFDSTLAVTNKEMRAYIEKGADGVDREVFVRSADSKPVLFEGRELPIAPIFRTKLAMGSDLGVRSRHLFSAIDQLPRREEMPKSPPRGPPSRGK